jgi:hypothetical protein
MPNPSHLCSHVSYSYVMIFWFIVNIDNSIQIDYMSFRLYGHNMNSVCRLFYYFYMGDYAYMFLFVNTDHSIQIHFMSIDDFLNSVC